MHMRLSCTRPTQPNMKEEFTATHCMYTRNSKRLSAPGKLTQTQTKCSMVSSLQTGQHTLLCASLTSASMTMKDCPSPFRTRKNSALRGSCWNFCTKVFNSCSSVRATLGEFPKNDTNRYATRAKACSRLGHHQPPLTPAPSHSHQHPLTHTSTLSLTPAPSHSHQHPLTRTSTLSLTPAPSHSQQHPLTHTSTLSLTPAPSHSHQHPLTRTSTLSQVDLYANSKLICPQSAHV